MSSISPAPVHSRLTDVLAFLSRLLKLTLGAAILITVVQLLLFQNGTDDTLDWSHLTIFIILSGAITYGMNARRYRTFNGRSVVSRLATGLFIAVVIAFFIMAINGLVSLLDYSLLMDNLLLPKGSVELFALQTFQLFCYLILFGFVYTACVNVLMPSDKAQEEGDGAQV